MRVDLLRSLEGEELYMHCEKKAMLRRDVTDEDRAVATVLSDLLERMTDEGIHAVGKYILLCAARNLYNGVKREPEVLIEVFSDRQLYGAINTTYPPGLSIPDDIDLEEMFVSQNGQRDR